MRNYFLILGFLLTLANAQATEGGGWVSSGGDGVVCFKTSRLAQQVARLLQKDHFFPLDMLPHVQSVEALDIFENFEQISYKRARAATSFDALYKERLSWLKEMSPLFEMQFSFVAREMHPKTWKEEEKIQEIDDSDYIFGDFQKKHPRCLITQIIARKSFSRPGEKPLLQLVRQPQLWQRLHPMHQVALFFHEVLYTLGREIGAYSPRRHQDSNDIRILVRAIMSDFLWEYWSHAPSNEETRQAKEAGQDLALGLRSSRSKFLRGIIDRFYGTYPLLFPTDLERLLSKGQEPQGPSQATRYRAFQAFLLESRRFIEFCQEQTPGRSHRSCLDVYMHPTTVDRYLGTLGEGVGDEIAFVFIVYWIYDISMEKFPAEEIMSWTLGESPQSDPATQQKLAYVCGRIPAMDWTPIMSPLVDRALAYCKRL